MAISSALGNAIVPTSYGFRNVIINGSFMVNQRAYVSGSNLASGAYGFDRWKSTFTNTALTFTSAPQGQLVTISSGGSIEQVVERANVPAGSYVLSWSGTAVGRVYNTGATPPAYSAGPLSVYLDGTANVEVEFAPVSGTATVGQVQLELGSRATPFEHRPVNMELLMCMRYYQGFVYGQVAEVYGGLGYSPANYYYGTQNLRIPMRATPSVSLSSISARRGSDASIIGASNVYYLTTTDATYWAFAAATGGYNAANFFISCSPASAEL